LNGILNSVIAARKKGEERKNRSKENYNKKRRKGEEVRKRDEDPASFPPLEPEKGEEGERGRKGG